MTERLLPIRRWVVSATLMCVLLLCAGWLIWGWIGPGIRDRDDYLVPPANIVVQPARPKWLKHDVLPEVIRDAGWQHPLRLLDRDLASQVAAAFALHPWVAEVKRVTKSLPAQLKVEIVYRQPVLMVACAVKSRAESLPGGTYPVDEQGVLLPGEDFTAAEVARYPLLTGVETLPDRPGLPWGDPKVSEAARLAALLLPDWESWQLADIVPGPRPAGVTLAQNWYYLRTRSGRTRILWGSAPGLSVGEEPTPADKVARLRSYFEGNGALDPPHDAHDLDVRGPLRMLISPRVAEQATDADASR